MIFWYKHKKPFDLYKLESGPEINVSCTKKEALDYYEKMQAIRKLELMAGNMYKEKDIRGFCHLMNGQVSLSFSFIQIKEINDTKQNWKLRKLSVLELKHQWIKTIA